jgi:hypothetical protein
MEDLYTPNSDNSRPVSTNNTTTTIDTNPVGGQSRTVLAFPDFTQIFISLMIFLFVALGVMVAVSLLARFIRKQLFYDKRLKDWKNTVILEIAVPKETVEQVQKESGSTNQKDVKESLGVGEQLFQMMSDYTEKGWKNWLYGGESFSLEIVNVDQEIRFWLVCNERTADVMERQLIAIYPKAHIVRSRKINFFKENTVAYVQELDLLTRFELPFKTYKFLDSDPLNPLTNSMAGLEKTESAAIQLVISPVRNKKWQKKSQLMALKIQQGQNPKEILFPEFNLAKEVWKIIKSIFKEIGGSKEEEKKRAEKREIDLTGTKSQLSLTPQQQEIIKKLEEKSAKPGFKFALRIVGSAETETRAKRIVENIVPAFQIYDVRPFNGIKKIKSNKKELLRDFILRSPRLTSENVINIEEINSIWHIPGWQVQNASIRWLLARKPPIPLSIPENIPGDTVYLGKSSARGQNKDIYIKTEDRFRHIYSLGGSGSGKTVTMNNVALQDIKMGNGVCVVDPHGESIDDLLRRIPPERLDDVIVFSPAITDRPCLKLILCNHNKKLW